MKKILVCLMVIGLLFSLGNAVFGNSGSADIPFYGASTTGAQTAINISNISISTISVKVTLYKNDGTILKDIGTDYIQGHNLSNFSDNLDSCSVSFILAANNSGYILIKSADTYGYGLIEWTQDSKINRGLLAYGNYIYGDGRFAIPINNGLPF